MSIQINAVEETAAEPTESQSLSQWAEPTVFDFRLQSRLTRPQLVVTRRRCRHALLFALHADELGAGGSGAAAMFLQPIGVDQPRRVVVGPLADRFQKH